MLRMVRLDLGVRKAFAFISLGLAFLAWPTPRAAGQSPIGSMPHMAAEENWTTTFTLINKDTAAAQVNLSFFGDASDPTGNGPLVLPVTFPQQPPPAGTQSSSLSLPLAAGASLIVKTGGPPTPPVLVGSAQLAATGAVDGFAIFHQNQTAQEAVVPMETRNASSYLLAFDNTNGLVLGVALENVTAQDAVIPVIIRDDGGKPIGGAGTISLGGNGHTSFVLSTQFPVTANIRGTIEFDTPAGGQISVLGLRFTPPNNALTTIPALANVGTGGGSIAHLASGGDGWQTTFVLVNTGSNAASATLSFYADQTGVPMTLPLTFPQGNITATTASSVTQALAAGATLIVVSAGSAQQLLTGSAQLSTSGNVSGFVIFRHNDQEAVVPLESRNANAYVLAFDNTSGTATGVAMNNVSSQAVNVGVVVRDDAGILVANDIVPLAANGHYAFTLGVDRYQAMLTRRGTIEFDPPAGVQIGVVGIRIPLAHTFTTLPALAAQPHGTNPSPGSVGAGVANWTFNTSTITGNTVSDTSGDGINATIIGNVVPVPGVSGQALSFDGGSYLQGSSDQRAALGGDLTLAAWIRTTNNSRPETILSKYDNSDSEDGYLFETTAAGYVGLHFGGSNISGGSVRDYVDGTNKINDGQWHHVAVIIRSGQDVSFYVDGGLSSIYYLTTFGGAVGSPLRIGGGPAGLPAWPLTGSLDEVGIYGRALSTAEIAQLYGGVVTTVPGGELLYNGVAMPKNFPPPTASTATLRAPTPYYINNPPRVVPIDVGRQLFVDDFLIEQTTLQRTQHQPSIFPTPVLTPGSPISGGAWFNPAKQIYEMWYYNTTNDYRYAYSTDGKNWTLPTYPDVLVPGTNEVVTGGDTIWLDQQETNPSRRYKAFGVDVGAGKIYVYFSADGIHFGPRQDFGIVSLSDRSSVFWNPFRKVWVNSDRASAQNIRARFYSESKDLTTWTPANPANTFWTGPDDHDPPYYLNNPGGQTPELYNLDAVAYESVMVGLFSWFYPGLGYKDYTLPGPILVEVGAGFSRDGFSWVRPTRGSGPNPGGAFIAASNTAGTFNAYNTQSVGGVLLVVGDELWFYFSGRTLQKPLDGTFSTGLATLRRDGFYSMDAGATPGTLVTHPLVFSGSHLFVNVNDPAGQLTVDVLDASGNLIPGFAGSTSVPISANATMREVTWSGANIASLAGQNVKFRFNLTNGSLYSFWVTASAQGASNGYVGAGGPGFTGVTDTVGSAGHP